MGAFVLRHHDDVLGVATVDVRVYIDRCRSMRLSEARIARFKSPSGDIAEHHTSTDVANVNFRSHLVSKWWQSSWNYETSHHVEARMHP